MSTWQTIDSAPRGWDKRILGWDGDHIAVTYWADGFKEWRDESEATDDGYGAESVPKHGTWEPTHWMPLPAPPMRGDTNVRPLAGPEKVE